MRTINQKRADIFCHIEMVINRLFEVRKELMKAGREYTEKDIQNFESELKVMGKFLSKVGYKFEELCVESNKNRRTK